MHCRTGDFSRLLRASIPESALNCRGVLQDSLIIELTVVFFLSDPPQNQFGVRGHRGQVRLASDDATLMGRISTFLQLLGYPEEPFLDVPGTGSEAIDPIRKAPGELRGVIGIVCGAGKC